MSDFNLTSFAHQILDSQEELQELRRRCIQLEAEVMEYRERDYRQMKMHEESFCKILAAAIDPNSALNQRMSK